MATIYTRASKGSALTWAEGDANITNLNNAKIELTNLSVSSSGDGSLTYNNTTGAFTYAGPGSTQYRSAFSAGTGITITSGVIASTVTGTVTNVSALTIGSTGTDVNSTVANGTTTPVITLNIPTASATNRGVLSSADWTTFNNKGTGTVTSVSGTGTINGLTLTGSVTGSGSLTLGGTLSLVSPPAIGSTTPNTGAFTTLTASTSVASPTVTTSGTTNLTINTNSGTNSGSIAIVQGANGNITITPNGTGQTLIKNLEYNENIFALGTTSGTITPDAANGNVQTITLNGNLTFSAFANPVAGQSITLIINTNGTGRTLTSTMLFAGASKTLSTTNTRDIISVFFDGTNYLASLAKDFR